MSAAAHLAEFRQFMADLRGAGGHLGLDPEFSAIERLVTVEGEAKLICLRENLDRFFFGRGRKVLERLEAKAADQGRSAVAQGLSRMRNEIAQLFVGQFVAYDATVLPQSDMLREMLRLFNEGRADDILSAMDRNIAHLEGHFFMILSESLRNVRARNEEPTYQVLLMIGRTVAVKRRERQLPCSFAFLYGV